MNARATLVALLLLSLPTGGGSPVRAAGAGDAQPIRAPLTAGDIVRMVVAGTDEGEILDAVRTASHAFDVSEEMLRELSGAGVPPAVIAAMKARVAAEARPGTTAPLPRGGVPLRVELAGAGSLELPAYAEEETKVRLGLPNEPELRAARDIALFLACVTPEHVPDLWRNKTPLGRDMSGAPRHEILAFVAGDTPAGKRAHLDVPDGLDAAVDTVEPHALVLGVAGRIGDRWYVLAASKPLKIEATAAGTALDGRVRASGPFAFEVEMSAPAAKVRAGAR